MPPEPGDAVPPVMDIAGKYYDIVRAAVRIVSGEAAGEQVQKSLIVLRKIAERMIFPVSVFLEQGHAGNEDAGAGQVVLPLFQRPPLVLLHELRRVAVVSDAVSFGARVGEEERHGVDVE